MAISVCTPDVDEIGRELTVHGSRSFPIACYHDDLAVESVPWHWHEELEAAIVTEGETILHVENDRYRLRAGEGFFINSGYLHACDYIGPGSCRFHSMSFHAGIVGGEEGSIFRKKYVDPLLEDSQLKGCILRPEVSWQDRALAQIEEVWQMCGAEPDGYELGVRSRLSDLLFSVLRHEGSALRTEPGRLHRDDHRIKQMISFMEMHCAEEITAEDIAKSAGISRSECLRVFRRTIDVTPMKYLNLLRIRKAAHLLAGTDQKIIEIGLECGFQDMSYFAKAFRREKGCTPGAYRKFARRTG